MCCNKQMVPTRQAVGEMETLAGDITAEDLARLDPSSVLCIRTMGKKWRGDLGLCARPGGPRSHLLPPGTKGIATDTCRPPQGFRGWQKYTLSNPLTGSTTEMCTCGGAQVGTLSLQSPLPSALHERPPVCHFVVGCVCVIFLSPQLEQFSE